MSETRRLKRQAGEDPELGSRRQSKVKYIYRLLREKDVGESLEGKTVYVLWPDDGTWYKGHVEECDAAAKKATIYYDETEEREEGADLEELIRDGQIAFKEPRPSSHVCRKGEIEVGTKYFGRQPGEEELEDDVEEAAGSSDDELADAGALEDTSDSDVSFSSAELSGRKRKRGSADDSDEDVVLEEFEKREIMRDMSDDEKPLGWRASELEQQQKKAAAAARRQEGGASATKKAAAPAASAGTPRKAAAAVTAVTAAAPAAALAQRPAQRPRREASAGVRAAAHAVAAVHAAAAEDASSDEEPPSARKHRQRQAAAAAGDDDDEADAYARALLARAAGKAAPAPRPGARGTASFYGASGASGSGNLERRVSMGQSEDELRSKVRASFQQALELVAKEAAGEAGKLPEAGAAAEAVEAALYTLFGGLTKDYKQKFRTLHFNLKDAHNPELRAHVLRGDIAPDAFVRMTATELASKELAAYRKAKEEEALKMSVLDAEAAARFSTAAALDARERLAIPASVMSDKGMLAAREATPEPAGPGGRSPSPAPPGATALSPTAAAAAAADSSLLGEQLSGRLETVGEEGGAGGTDASASGYLASESAEAELAGGEEYDPETAFADEAPRITAGAAGGAAGGAPAPAATPTAAALDWASIKAAAAAAGHEGDGAGHALQPLKFEPLASVGATHEGGQAGAEGQREHKHHHKRERPSASPRDPEASDAGGSQQLAEPGSPHSLRHLVLPPTDPACLFGKGVWEGQFSVPGSGAFLLTADALAGSGDVAGLLGEQELEVKGRLALHKLDHFLTELRHSRSRTVTLGMLSPAEDCSPEERAALRELIASYADRGRTGVAAPARDVEAYLLPPCPIAERLLSAARATAGPQVEALLPGGGTAIGADQLLLCIIHRKDWRVPYGLARPIRRPRVLPPPGAAPAAPPAAGEPAGEAAGAPAEPLGAPAVSLPHGLDLSQLGALAAALGVAPAPAEQQAPATAPAMQPPAAAALPQADQLQQLLASLPPAVAPGAVQPAEGGQRRSRWEGGDGGEAAAPAGQLDDQGRRRSRWTEERGDQEFGQEFGQQPPGGMLPPPGAGQPPAPGPMGPMHRAGMPPPSAMPPQQMPPPGMQPPMQPQQQPQQYGGPPGSMPMQQPQFGGPPGSVPMQPQQFGGAPPPGSMPFQQQHGPGGLPPPPPMQPFVGGPQGMGMPPQHQMGMQPPGSMPMQPQPQQPGGYGGAPAWQGGQGQPGQFGGQYNGPPRGPGYGRGGRGFDGGRGGRGGRWRGGGGRFEGRGGRGRY